MKKIANELSIANGYVNVSTKNLNSSDCRTTITSSENAINSLDNVYYLALNLQVPVVPFSDLAIDVLKNFRLVADYYKQSMQARIQHCTLTLQLTNLNEVLRLLDEDFRLWDLARDTLDNELIPKLATLNVKGENYLNSK